jgi:PAS domain S-box-containing protein
MMLLSSSSSHAAVVAASRAVARQPLTGQRRAMGVAAWSGSLSHATPESDFCAAAAFPHKQQQQQQHKQQQHSNMSTWVWSHSYSFASPESDFTSNHPGWSGQSRVLVSEPMPLQQEQRVIPNWSHTLNFASPESDFTTSRPHVEELLLSQCQARRHGHARRFLPTTLAEALHETERAVVVTSVDAPHRIIHVNHAWEDLCGYTKQQVLHRTLQLIQGPETNPQLVLQAVAEIVQAHQQQGKQQQQQEKDVYVVNYKQDGSKFINHLTLGPLALYQNTNSNGQRSLDFLVGILEPVSREQVPLRLATAG